jgi:hypothetical protein
MTSSAIDPRVQRLLEREVTRAFGTGVPWRVYRPDMRTPLNAVLDIVSRRISDPLLVWVDGGSPEVFSLGGPAAVAVWSTRHLEIASAVRTLLVHNALGDQRRELARRTALSVVAELSLRHDRPAHAARSFLHSVRGQDWFVPHADRLLDLEAARIDEAYVTVWCFTVAHEFGHHLPAGEFPDDATMRDMVLEALRAIPHVGRDADVLSRLLDDIRTDRRHPNRPEHLRGEVVADLFAAEMMIHAAAELMNAAGNSPRGDLLAIEILIAHTGISFVERCQALSEALTEPEDPRTWLRLLHATAGLHVRERLMRQYVLSAIGGLIPTGQRASWVRTVVAALDDLATVVDVIDGGIADAMAALLWSSTRGSELLDAVRAECDDPLHRAMLRAENRAFRELAIAKRHAPTEKKADPLMAAIVTLLS